MSEQKPKITPDQAHLYLRFRGYQALSLWFSWMGAIIAGVGCGIYELATGEVADWGKVLFLGMFVPFMTLRTMSAGLWRRLLREKGSNG